MKKQETSLKTEENIILGENEAFTLPLSELSKRLKINLESGLSQQDAEERLKQVGPNIVPRVKTHSLRVYLEPLSNWLVITYLIVIALLVSLALLVLPQLWFQVSLWLPMIAINIVIIVIQTARAQTEITALQQLSSPKSYALRGTKLTELYSENIVPGDIIWLKQGDMIPADSRIITSSNLRVNEAPLTGESIEVEKCKETNIDLEETTILRKKNSLFLGTFIITGTATALVVETGKHTQLGKMASKLRKINTPKILLRQRINKLARNLALIILLYLSISIAYSITVLYLNARLSAISLTSNIAENLITAISLMPINIPLLVTIIMLTGALSMAQHKVIIRNLNSIENLGRVSIVCADKTGTITENKMTTKWLYIPTKDEEDNLYYVTTPESVAESKIVAVNHPDLKKAIENTQEYQDKKPVEIAPDTPLGYLLASALLNNDNFVVENGNSIDPCQKQAGNSVTGDATDMAMLCLFSKSNIDSKAYRIKFQVVQSWSLDPQSKLITRVLKDNKTNQHILFTKGATETLLTKCEYILSEKNEDQTFNLEDKSRVAENAEIFSQFGNRIISFAFRRIDNFDPKDAREHIENTLTYLGYVAISDPPREGICHAVSELREAGIRPVMITGDNLGIAKSVAEEVGIMEENQLVAEGSQIQNLSDQNFLNTAAFARVSPDDKRVIVARYKEQNYVVAMTGDGVNDSQAILTADVGIAMGTGTEVAKQTADLVIADDSFNSIVTGIREGRGVFEKIQNVIFFYLAISLAEVLVYFSASFIQNFFFLHIWQLIYLATIQFILPFALVIDKLNQDVMKEKPRSKEEFISGHRRTLLIVFALSLSIMLATVYLLTLNGVMPVFEANKGGFIPNLNPVDPRNSINWEQAKARTMFISVIVVAASTLILSLRRLNKPIYKSLRQDMNRKIWLIILSIPIVHLILMYTPMIQYGLLGLGINLEIIQLTSIDWLIVLSLGLIPIALLESTKLIQHKNRKMTKTLTVT